nr:MFS transporter [Candidatus Sigynarchaeum springense]
MANDVVNEPTNRETIIFGFGSLTDQMSHQAFQSFIFMFYYAVIGIDVSILAIGFIVFAIWDSVNDPIIGPISDRTSTRWGRRKFWILVSIIPFGIVNLLLFTAPIGNETLAIIYFLFIIMLYDLVYTIFSTNQLSLFPEMFKTEKKRSQANMIRNLQLVLGVLLGAVLPTIIVKPMVPDVLNPPATVYAEYIIAGGILAILVLVFGVLFWKFGMREDPTSLTKPKETPSIMTSLKQTLTNKAFLIFVIANLLRWFVFKMLTTIIILYGINVLKIGKESFLLTALLLVAFLSAAAFFPVMRKIGQKIGNRNGFIATSIEWIVALVPFWFLDNNPIGGLVCMAFMGFGLSGSMYYADLIIADIIDDDEVRSGCRREGAIYGVNGLINRYSTILVFVVIALVLTGFGWEEFLLDPKEFQIEGLVIGLKLLMVVFPIIATVGIIVLLKLFPIHGERLRQIQEQVKAIRDRKACEKT